MCYGVNKVAWQVKELETNPDVLSSIPSNLQGKRKEPTPETFLCTRWHVNKSPRTQCTQTHKMMVYRFCMYKQVLQKNKCFQILNWKERDLFIFIFILFVARVCIRICPCKSAKEHTQKSEDKFWEPAFSFRSKFHLPNLGARLVLQTPLPTGQSCWSRSAF